MDRRPLRESTCPIRKKKVPQKFFSANHKAPLHSISSIRKDKEQSNESNETCDRSIDISTSISQDKTKEVAKEYVSSVVFFTNIQVGVFDLLCLFYAIVRTRVM